MWPVLRHGAGSPRGEDEPSAGTDAERQRRPRFVARVLATRPGGRANRFCHGAGDHGGAAAAEPPAAATCATRIRAERRDHGPPECPTTEVSECRRDASVPPHASAIARIAAVGPGSGP